MKTKNISGAKKIELAVELSEMVKELAIAGLKRQNPNATKDELKNLWAREISSLYL